MGTRHVIVIPTPYVEFEDSCRDLMAKTRNIVAATEHFYLALTWHAKISGAFLFAFYRDIYES